MTAQEELLDCPWQCWPFVGSSIIMVALTHTQREIFLVEKIRRMERQTMSYVTLSKCTIRYSYSIRYLSITLKKNPNTSRVPLPPPWCNDANSPKSFAREDGRRQIESQRKNACQQSYIPLTATRIQQQKQRQRISGYEYHYARNNSSPIPLSLTTTWETLGGSRFTKKSLV